MAMWQPDGWARTRNGILTPHADLWPEAEFGAMAPNGISIHAARVAFGAYKPDGTMDRTIADEPVRALPTRHWSMTLPSCSHRLRCMRSPTASPAAATCAAPPMMPG